MISKNECLVAGSCGHKLQNPQKRKFLTFSDRLSDSQEKDCYKRVIKIKRVTMFFCLDFIFWWLRIWRLLSSLSLGRVGVQKFATVSVFITASIFRAASLPDDRSNRYFWNVCQLPTIVINFTVCDENFIKSLDNCRHLPHRNNLVSIVAISEQWRLALKFPLKWNVPSGMAWSL